MECVTCKAVVRGVNKMKEHYVRVHNVPSNDAILNRYIKLHFSSTSYSSWSAIKRVEKKASVTRQL